MKKFTLFITVMVYTMAITLAQDWQGIPVPADAGPGMKWEQMPQSDSFNYSSKQNNQFTSKWNEGYPNGWSGPGLTEWRAESSYLTNGLLAMSAHRKPGTNQVFLGCISSKQTYTYPMYLEINAKISDMVLASNFWLISTDQTEEIDVLEAYGSGRPGQEWFSERIHLSHHVFIRDPFTDYQPTDAGSWYYRNGTRWRENFHRVGVYWKDPWNLEYYVDGVRVRTVSGPNIIDPNNFTNGTGLSKGMNVVINSEDQNWRSDNGIFATDEELNDINKSVYYIDWVRFYKPVPNDSNPGNGNVVNVKRGTNTNFAIDGNFGGANAQNVYQWQFGSNNVNQKWVEINRGNGFFSYQKQGTNFCLDAGNGGANGQNVYLWTCNNGNQNQHFRKVNIGNGRVRLEKRNAPGFSLDGGNGVANLQNVYLYASSNTNINQQWLISTVAGNGRTSAIEEFDFNLEPKLYPNPIKSNQFNVGGLDPSFDTIVKIYNSKGTEVLSEKFTGASAYQVNMHEKVNGLYMVTIENGEKSIDTKLIVE